VLFSITKNMNFQEYVKSYFYIIDPFRRYKKTYKNYFTVIINILKQHFPIEAILKTGEKKTLYNYYEAYLTTYGVYDSYKIEDDTIHIFNKKLPTISINLGNNNGDVYSVFFQQVYSFLPVKDKVVIDIGANIGDSSIYFGLQGAKKVIAVEPIPKNFEIAKTNIKQNNLEEKIDLLLAGCSNNSGFLYIDPEKEGAGSSIQHAEHKLQIQLKTLNDIIHEYNYEPTVLKLDCEGCEYDVILSSNNETLRNFSHIQIEYHYGYLNLKNKLESCGFHVEVTKPHFIRNKQAGKNMFYGYLYAKK